jgi:hypothetical protein
MAPQGKALLSLRSLGRLNEGFTWQEKAVVIKVFTLSPANINCSIPAHITVAMHKLIPLMRLLVLIAKTLFQGEMDSYSYKARGGPIRYPKDIPSTTTAELQHTTNELSLKLSQLMVKDQKQISNRATYLTKTKKTTACRRRAAKKGPLEVKISEAEELLSRRSPYEALSSLNKHLFDCPEKCLAERRFCDDCKKIKYDHYIDYLKAANAERAVKRVIGSGLCQLPNELIVEILRELVVISDNILVINAKLDLCRLDIVFGWARIRLRYLPQVEIDGVAVPTEEVLGPQLQEAVYQLHKERSG